MPEILAKVDKRKTKGDLSFKLYLVLSWLWAYFLLIATCTANPSLFISNQEILLHFNPNPHIEDLFITSDLRLTDSDWIFYKMGHFFGFSILAFLLIGAFKKIRSAILISIFLSLLTEVLQLFFYRDGRLVDVGIDTLGILLACLITMLLSYPEEKVASQ